jgi:hypothetical protein
MAVNDLEKKQGQRRRFLRRLYEVTGGHRFTHVSAHEIAADVGLTRQPTSRTTWRAGSR